MARNQSINGLPQDIAIITTDGAGAISLDYATSGVSAADWVTDGTNGEITVTLATRANLFFAVATSFSAATIGAVQVVTQAVGSLTLLATDFATPSDIDLAATASQITVTLTG